MPSYPMSQFCDLEEMMCKHLFNLDMREQGRQLPPLNLAMRTPGYIGQSSSNTSLSLSSLSCLPSDPPDSTLLTPNPWGQQSESCLPSQLTNSNQWVKPGFFAQRSISMVETSSTTAASLGWPGTDMKHTQSDISPTALNTNSSSSSSSSRYKTELCRSFTESGLCKYGGKCQFAHGPEELRDLSRHPKYKTEPCRTFHTIGFCPYGIRCHFVHNNEEERRHSFSRSSSTFSNSSSSIPPQQPSSSSSRPNRPPLVRQSFSFAGFPSAPQQCLQQALTPSPGTASLTRAPSASPPSCADVTDLLSHAFLEMDSAFKASSGLKYQPPIGQAAAIDARSPFLPSPDSGCYPCGLSPTTSPSLRQSPGAASVFSGPLGTRSLSYTSLSDQDQDGSSSTSSLSGSESCGGVNEANGRRLAVFSQLSVPEDPAGLSL